MNLRTPVVAAAAAIAALAIACALVQPATATSAGYIAKITNSTDTVATATAFTCDQAQKQGAAVFSYPLTDATSTTVAADVSGNLRNGTYFYTRATSTAVSRSCPRDAAGAYVLAGIVIPGNTAVLSPQLAAPTAFSLELWFKTGSTTSAAAGQLMGFGTSNNTTLGSLTISRQLYVSTAGNVVFGQTATSTITSSGTYRDTNWHHVIVTVSSGTGATSTMYVDGAQVASGPAGTGASTAAAYWHLGFDAYGIGSGWPNVNAASMAFVGSLRWASLYASALTPTAVATHYRAATAP